MERTYYLNLAKQGIAFPIASHLVLSEQDDHDAVRRDGRRLGEVIAETSKRYHCPLGLSLMDLAVEKTQLLHAVDGVTEENIDAWQFTAVSR